MIGAGVLALPTVAAPSGLIPSTTTLLAVWAYMSITGLLISGKSILSMFSIDNIPLVFYPIQSCSSD